MTADPVTVTPDCPVTPAVDSTRRSGAVDALRALACLMVVFAHCCDGFVGAFDSDRTAFLWGAALGSLARPSVPLFVFITAFLILPVPQSITQGSFYRKRIGRILPPLIFWSVALPVMFYLLYAHITPATTNPMVDAGAYNPSGLWQKIWMMVFNFNFDTVPLWYLYMLVGIYLIIPLINPWLHQASRRDMLTVLLIWGFTLFLPAIKLMAPHAGYTGNFGSMEILGACDWNAYGTFYYITGFIGYLVLACYLKRWPPQWSRAKAWAICLPMFLAGYAITFGGFVLIQNYHPGDYSYLEVIWYFTGINVFMMTFPVIIAFRRMSIKPRRWLERLARLTFGIYLCHFIFVYITFDLFNIPALAPGLRILCMTLTSFGAAALLTALCRSWSVTRRFVD